MSESERERESETDRHRERERDGVLPLCLYISTHTLTSLPLSPQPKRTSFLPSHRLPLCLSGPAGSTQGFGVMRPGLGAWNLIGPMDLLHPELDVMASYDTMQNPEFWQIAKLCEIYHGPKGLPKLRNINLELRLVNQCEMRHLDWRELNHLQQGVTVDPQLAEVLDEAA